MQRIKPVFLWGIVLIVVLNTTSASYFHPYYVSTTEIRINPEQKSINLSCKMFTDDLQDALSTLYKMPVELEKRTPKVDILLNLYIKERVEISVGSEKVNFKYVGYEIDEESPWCYFESALASRDKTVKVKASILYDFIETQTNFVHCYYGNEKKSFKLDKPNQDATFNFESK